MSFLTDTQKSLVDRIGDAAPDVEARMMLGNVGLYVNDTQIGILDGDSVYLRADDDMRDTFEEKGATPYNSSGGVAQIAYFKVPPAVLDDDDALTAWVNHAVEAG